MKIKSLTLHPYEIPLTHRQIRQGVLIKIQDHEGSVGWGEAAPLPQWSRETLDDVLRQIEQKQSEIVQVDWTDCNVLHEISKLELLPSVCFGLESALFAVLSPIAEHKVQTSALLMGSSKEIMEQASLRLQEGYTYAKLKVSNLDFEEVARIIDQLKDKFRLRIDVNRAWKTTESLHFFEQFPLDAFDYVEEPFQNPKDLAIFPHPLAIDESFSEELTLEQLESLPTLKAVIYKPTIQGGLLGCLQLREWAKQNGIDLILSSSFESDIGLACIATMAHRLSMTSPVGIGTYHYLGQYLCDPALRFDRSFIYLPERIQLLL